MSTINEFRYRSDFARELDKAVLHFFKTLKKLKLVSRENYIHIMRDIPTKLYEIPLTADKIPVNPELSE